MIVVVVLLVAYTQNDSHGGSTGPGWCLLYRPAGVNKRVQMLSCDRQKAGENATRSSSRFTTDAPPTFATTADVMTNTTPEASTTGARPHAGTCPNMPSGINVNVLYAEAGLTGYQPIYMIVGAYIT